MQGVAEGLSTLHTRFKNTKIAYHQDLKPANILVVKRKLKIADFGLLEFKPVTLLGDTDLTGIPDNHNTGFYAAPRKGKYTRACDIWSLGCIMSEVATCDIQGWGGVSDYKRARIADGSLGQDTPRFSNGNKVKNSVLYMHTQLHDYVQSAKRTDSNSAARFQKRFYKKEFFALLDRMFRRSCISADLLDVPGEEITIDAAQVAETLEELRKEALPATLLHSEARNPGLEQYLQDTDSLGFSMESHLTDFRKTLNRKNREKFPTTTMASLKQYIFNLQQTQHAERRQQGLSRLGPFIERFGEFNELIANVPSAREIMGFIWVYSSLLVEQGQD